MWFVYSSFPETICILKIQCDLTLAPTAEDDKLTIPVILLSWPRSYFVQAGDYVIRGKIFKVSSTDSGQWCVHCLAIVSYIVWQWGTLLFWWHDDESFGKWMTVSILKTRHKRKKNNNRDPSTDLTSWNWINLSFFHWLANPTVAVVVLVNINNYNLNHSPQPTKRPSQHGLCLLVFSSDISDKSCPKR